MAENDTRLETLEDEVKVLKGEVKRTLVDLRALLMREDSPLGEGALARRMAMQNPNAGNEAAPAPEVASAPAMPQAAPMPMPTPGPGPAAPPQPAMPQAAPMPGPGPGPGAFPVFIPQPMPVPQGSPSAGPVPGADLSALAEQERRMAEQERRIAEQERRMAEQDRDLAKASRLDAEESRRQESHKQESNNHAGDPAEDLPPEEDLPRAVPGLADLWAEGAEEPDPGPEPEPELEPVAAPEPPSSGGGDKPAKNPIKPSAGKKTNQPAAPRPAPEIPAPDLAEDAADQSGAPSENERVISIYDEYRDLLEETQKTHPIEDSPVGPPLDVNLLSNLVYWAALAKQRVGEEQLKDILQLYIQSGHSRPELMDLLLHISDMVDSEPPEVDEAVHEWVDLMFHLHGILTGGFPVVKIPQIKLPARDQDQDQDRGQDDEG